MPESPSVENISIKDPNALTIQDYSQLLHTSKDSLLEWAHKQGLEVSTTDSPVTASEDASMIRGLGGHLPIFGDNSAMKAIFKDGKTIYLWCAVAGGIPKNEDLAACTKRAVEGFERAFGSVTAHDSVGDSENFNFNAGDIVVHVSVSPYREQPHCAYLAVSFELQSRFTARMEKQFANGTMPADWKPKFRFNMQEIPVPFGQSLPDFSKFLQRNRIEVIEGSQDEDMRSWTAPNIVTVVPGWGVAKGINFDFTNDSGEWRLKQVMLVRVLQMDPTWLKKRFDMTVGTLTQCFGKPEIEDGKARWNKEGFYITLAISRDGNNIGYQREGALLLAFTRK